MVITVGNLEVTVMKKSITREQITETALTLLKDKSNIRDVNLRQIARVLGCAHTNLYNYFPSYNDLLWEAHMEIENRFIHKVSLELECLQEDKQKLKQFFFSMVEFYLDNRGWFRLAWLDYIDDDRPEKDKITTDSVVNTMVEMLEKIWFSTHENAPDRKRIFCILHDVHCYIIGEVSNYINDRGLIQDTQLLKRHITETAVTFFTLALKEE